jgi:hypothetical protein
MVGFMVREVKLEQVQVAVDGRDQTDLLGQGMQDAQAAAGDATGTIGDLIVDVGGGEHRPMAAAVVGFIQAALDASLAMAQLLAYSSFHLKSLWGVGESWSYLTMKPWKTPRGFKFFQNSPPKSPGNLACFRSSLLPSCWVTNTVRSQTSAVPLSLQQRIRCSF